MTQGAASGHKLAAIMIADVAGFSRLMERDESLTFARLRRLREEVNFPKIEEHGGRVIKTTGDARQDVSFAAVGVKGMFVKEIEEALEVLEAIKRAREMGTGVISLRGRDFSIIGIFQNGTYMDNQAWISLADAQTLLGWGEDVSVFIIPDEGILHEGQSLPGGLAVSRKGRDLRLIAAQYRPILDIWQWVSLALGAATALTLTSLLSRLAWLRRREMAILRTLGFPVRSMVVYLLVQAAAQAALARLQHERTKRVAGVPRLGRGGLAFGGRWVVLRSDARHSKRDPSGGPASISRPPAKTIARALTGILWDHRSCRSLRPRAKSR